MTKVQIKTENCYILLIKIPPTVFSLLREILQLYDFRILFYFYAFAIKES